MFIKQNSSFLDMIPIGKPLLGEEEKRAVMGVLDSGMLAHGSVVKKFEEDFATYIDVKHAIATSNGTTALHAALLAHGIEAGDEVITTPFTFIATVNMIRSVGATPVFVDIEEHSFNINPDLIEEKITAKTKVILPVHLFGKVANMNKITNIAKKHNLIIIEDAAQAHGATQDTKKAGSFGTGCFSFYATKNMTTGEGGMITTNDDQIANKIRMLITHGSTEKYAHKMHGFNYRMTNIAAALGRIQLLKLPVFNQRRRANALFFTQKLANTPTDDPGHVYHQYVLLVDKRDNFQAHLAKNNIATAVHYPLPIHKQEAYKEYTDLHFPIAESVAARVVSIPVAPYLSENEREHIVNTIQEALKVII